MVSVDKIWEELSTISDPEIPVISILELGVLRDVKFVNNTLHIIITPTYSGCPAMNQIEKDIAVKLVDLGIISYKINLQYNPTWTTDWMTDKAKKKLLDYGISPPDNSVDKGSLLGKDKSTLCPNCKSKDTKMISQFGSTACKAMYQCNQCMEPYDYFKCL
ncbi:MAG: phenylacetate-CoA oxygenase subunit PaaJ [Flavobacteriales bacterium]|jgi:ring-1,2-phenylacetyl-CoA epoxidase subunit PaaD|nr:phenylacetate-CoA oxygenase subunit PaaJ [Flavobacteriales bacterium]